MPRIVSYNVHRCVGADRRMDVGRTADLLAALSPDIVALQELDVGRARTGGVDQAHELAQRLGMAFHFHAALQVETELYGDAILTIHPERKVRTGALPGDPRIPQLEPRGALWVAVTLEGQEVQVINTHLGLTPAEQRNQAAHLAGDLWLGAPQMQGPAILIGDFNATRGSQTYETLTRRMVAARDIAPIRRATATFPAVFPVLRIDHAFVSPQIQVLDVSAPYTPQTRAASDHSPLVIDFALRDPAAE